MTTATKPTSTHSSASTTAVTLAADSNQALGIGQFAVDFMNGAIGKPDQSVINRTVQFFTDSVLCGLSAIALGTNAPTVLRNESLRYKCEAASGPGKGGATIFGNSTRVHPEKAVVANSAAVREWDSNGTNFGYNPTLNHTAGEFGHNDFYPVALAAAQVASKDGAFALRGMMLSDEIRGRLAEVFSLKSYKIDHVVHGAIASAATYGAMMGATAEQIESAIGIVVAHYIPWRAIRAGKQLSDSKGASAAISTEVAVLSMIRSMNGFVGPRDIFRNPEAIFRFFEPTTQGKDRWKEMAPSPFDLVLSHSGSDFAVMGMHFKIGLYEHQSAGALQAIIDHVAANPHLLDDSGGGKIKSIRILAYEPAFGIIGNPAKMDPKTRQSADHSMAYIVSTLLRKAIEYKKLHGSLPGVQKPSPQPSPTPVKGRASNGTDSHDAIWKALMLSPHDYAVSDDAIFHPVTRAIMKKISFEHGGADYDKNYPDGIPTSVVITDDSGKTFDSGLVMYPAGHARNTTCNLNDLLKTKFMMHGTLALDNPQPIIDRYNSIAKLSADDVQRINDYDLPVRGHFE